MHVFPCFLIFSRRMTLSWGHMIDIVLLAGWTLPPPELHRASKRCNVVRGATDRLQASCGSKEGHLLAAKSAKHWMWAKPCLSLLGLGKGWKRNIAFQISTPNLETNRNKGFPNFNVSKHVRKWYEYVWMRSRISKLIGNGSGQSLYMQNFSTR